VKPEPVFPPVESAKSKEMPARIGPNAGGATAPGPCSRRHNARAHLLHHGTAGRRVTSMLRAAEVGPATRSHISARERR